MKNTGMVDLPLHGGKCPRWLFPLMKKLAGKISELIADEYGEEELLKRISNPYWFQSFGCVLGFDWHSSGLTTTTTGALKEALKEKDLGVSLGIGFAGGKGKTSRKTPDEIFDIGDKLGLNEKKKNELMRSSRLSAKVDNSLLQDGFQLYHHSFFFTKKSWIVVQQGMEQNFSKKFYQKDTNFSKKFYKKGYARRYHWLSHEDLNFVNEPHSAIVSDKITNPLNLVAKESKETRKCSLELIKENPIHLKKYLKPLKIKYGQKTLLDFSGFEMPREHFPEINFELKTLIKAYEEKPDNYEEFVLVNGMGQKNIRALALISHLVYGTEISWKDPVKYSFCHGGKDGWPFPVERERYRENIEFLGKAIRDAKIGEKEKTFALKRLDRFYSSINE